MVNFGSRCLPPRAGLSTEPYDMQQQPEVVIESMRPARLYICNLVFRLIPETRCFNLKASLLRWAGVKMGNNVRVCSSVTVLGFGCLEIGDDTWIGHQTVLVSGSSIRIGCCVDVGPKVFIGTGTHEIDVRGEHSAGLGVHKDVIVGNGVWLGVGATVLPGVCIGKKAVVAAGAVVTRDVSEAVIVAGIPARTLTVLDK